jgi:hypothetical protein
MATPLDSSATENLLNQASPKKKKKEKTQEERDRDQAIALYDDPILKSIKEKLLEYKEKYYASTSELSFGLGISRPTISEFLGQKDLENNEASSISNEPKFSRGRILHLFNVLTKEERITPSNKKKIEERQKLKKTGPDELLIAAGMLPAKKKNIFVSSRLEPQLTYISFLYEDQPLDPNLYSQIVKQELERRKSIYWKNRYESDRNNTEKSDVQTQDLVNSLINNTWISSTIKKDVEKQYYSAILTMNKKNKLVENEKSGLLKSILSNRISLDERFEVNLVVQNIERETISIPWVKDYKTENIISEIKKSDVECENVFKVPNVTLYPLTKTIIHCHLHKKNVADMEEIKFQYVSTGTILETATAAISQSMGFEHSVKETEMSMMWLGNDIKSLVETVVTITDHSGELIYGGWVSSDLVGSIIQAKIITGNKWFRYACRSINPENYELVMKETALLKQNFYERRLACDDFDIGNYSSEVEGLSEIIKMAESNIEKIKEILPKKGMGTFLSTSYRIYILSQIYKVHNYNSQLDWKKCREGIIEIEKLINNTDSEENKAIESVNKLFTLAAKISLAVEKIAYNLSFGINYNFKSKTENPEIMLIDDSLKYTLESIEEYNLIEINNITCFFEKIDEYIENIIKNFGKDPGYDIYHSLGSYHSIIGRLLFYTGKNSDYLRAAFNRFLKAACYFQKTGSTMKVQRSLALAGRIQARLGDNSMAKECIELSEYIKGNAKSKFTLLHKESFLLSIDSRIQLLTAERYLIFENDQRASMNKCLQSLKSALKLGLNRHIMDILYTILECSKGFEESVKADLDREFSELSMDDWKLQIVTQGENNEVAIKVANYLHDYYEKLNSEKDPNNPFFWSGITKDLQTLLTNEWNTWHEKASGGDNNKHPISIMIEKGEFLQRFSK